MRCHSRVEEQLRKRCAVWHLNEVLHNPLTAWQMALEIDVAIGQATQNWALNALSLEPVRHFFFSSENAL